MTVNTTNSLLNTTNMALKVVEVIPGTINLGATGSSTTVTNTIPHGYGTDSILVNCTSNFPSGPGNYLATTPFGSTVRGMTVTWDATNVYVRAFSNASEGAAPALTFNYVLSIIIP